VTGGWVDAVLLGMGVVAAHLGASLGVGHHGLCGDEREGKGKDSASYSSVASGREREEVRTLISLLSSHHRSLKRTKVDRKADESAKLDKGERRRERVEGSSPSEDPPRTLHKRSWAASEASPNLPFIASSCSR
jgi:hypothetical protein